MPPQKNLDLDTLRTLAVAHDVGGLAQAADLLGRTPSAISLQMKRLQDDLGLPLFRKRGRGVVLTEAGEVALSYTRRMLAIHDELLDTMHGAKLAGHIRIGCTQDFAAILPSALSRFALLHPHMQVELRIEGNAALADAVESSQLDLAVIVGQEHRAAAKLLGQLDLVWIAASTFRPRPDQPLPLATLGPQCVFRKRAIEHLESAGIPYRIAANSPSLHGLWVALLGGLGITARTRFNLPEGLTAAQTRDDLPVLGQLAVTLHRGVHGNGAAIDRMETLLREMLAPVLSAETRQDPARDSNRRKRVLHT